MVLNLGMMEKGKRLEDGDTVVPGGGFHRLQVLQGGHQRLLAHDVLAGPGGANGPFGVQGVGQRVVDGVDLRILNQLLVAAVGPWDPVCRGIGLGLFQTAAGHRRQPAAPGTLHGSHHGHVDPGRRQQTPADLVGDERHGGEGNPSLVAAFALGASPPKASRNDQCVKTRNSRHHRWEPGGCQGGERRRSGLARNAGCRIKPGYGHPRLQPQPPSPYEV